MSVGLDTPGRRDWTPAAGKLDTSRRQNWTLAAARLDIDVPESEWYTQIAFTHTEDMATVETDQSAV